MMSMHPELDWWLAGPIAASGQVLGKMVYYFAARGAITLPQLLQRSMQKQPNRGWLQWCHRFQRECQDRPLWSIGVVLSSSVFGVPPFALLIVSAGLTRLPLAIFFPASVVGRVARFCTIASSPALIQAWWF
jgi:membrane protein YqaA with SNARE-associated domain